MRHKINILLAENNDNDAALIKSILVGSGVNVNIVHVNTRRDALIEIQKSVPDLILLDLELPNGKGSYLLDVIREAAPDVPIVNFSDHDDTSEQEIASIAASTWIDKHYLTKKYLLSAMIDSANLIKAKMQSRHADTLVGECIVALTEMSDLMSRCDDRTLDECATDLAEFYGHVADRLGGG